MYNLLRVEINSATDNPMVFSDTKSILSAGNFHGEYPAKACDYLAIGTAEIAGISERRIERLNNSSLNGHLPPFLVRSGGLNSGTLCEESQKSFPFDSISFRLHDGSCDSCCGDE